MTTRKSKSVSFDAMVKFFMQHYNIPTKKDVNKLLLRMDRMENMLKVSAALGNRRRISYGSSAEGNMLAGRSEMTASGTVLEIIKRSRKGAGFSDIKSRTGYGEKKLRNIIFRLNKIGKIKRKERGVYVGA